MKIKFALLYMERLLEQVEKDINKYGNVRPATFKKLEKFMKKKPSFRRTNKR